jgi:hypothetical protein
MLRLWNIIIVAILLGACTLQSPPPKTKSAPDQNAGADRTDVLIYSGEGSWGDEVDSLAEILYEHNVTYVEWDEDDLNDASEKSLRQFSLILFPGGDSDLVTKYLKPETRDRIRKAVREEGTNYLGFCAGAWAVVSPEKDNYGFRLVEGPYLQRTPYYKKGLEFSIANAEFPDGTRRDLLWFGGPVTPDIPGGVIAKYPDGTPAISEMYAGKGFIIISGLHPAVNKLILNKIELYNKQAIDPKYAWKLMNAALHSQPLPAF